MDVGEHVGERWDSMLKDSKTKIFARANQQRVDAEFTLKQNLNPKYSRIDEILLSRPLEAHTKKVNQIVTTDV